jgi:peptidoglycan/LPS O-acetylase OafA/YrhL
MYHTAMQAKKEHFRSDIAILRGFSIALVILCHFNFRGFSFGFIGVDIFFVISGYLISQSLYREFISLDDNGNNSRTISLATFYIRRIRRLLPAALTVVLVVNLISFFIYNSEIRRALISDSKWAFIFLANVAFLRSKSNYFQMGSEPSFLEHYWSLSVEEQFYVFWPLLFLLAATFKKFKVRRKLIRFNNRLLFIFFVASLSSYLFLQHGLSNSPLQAYFSLFSRAWELGVGGFFGVLTYQKRKITIFSLTERLVPFGMSILVAIIFIDQSNWATLIVLPVIATGFLLYPGNLYQSEAILKRDKASFIYKYGLYLGAISYSLYLVHWPIYVIAQHENYTDGYVNKFALIIASIICAHFLRKYVELPFQRIPISKLFKRDVKIFDYLKSRRKIVNFLIFGVLGALYLVSFPINGSNNLSSNLTSSGTVANIKNFAYYESQLVNQPEAVSTASPNESTTSESQPTQLSGNLGALLAANRAHLSTWIKDVQLSPTDVKNLDKAKTDSSKFESSTCAQQINGTPPVECLTKSNVKNPKKVILIGDSKMAMLSTPIGDYFESKGWQVQYDSMFGCHISYGSSDSAMKPCMERHQWTIANLTKNKYDLIVISEYPTKPTDPELQAQFYNLALQSGQKMLYLGNMAHTPKPSECITKTNVMKVACTLVNVNETSNINWNKQTVSALPTNKVIFFDSSQWYCVNRNCPILVEGNFVFRDGVHLSNTYQQILVPLINATLDNIIQN